MKHSADSRTPDATDGAVGPYPQYRVIASYLHAEPCQQLTALNFRLEALRRCLDPAAPISTASARRSVCEVIELGMQCTHQIRGLINWLRYDGVDSSRLDECLAAAVAMNGDNSKPVQVANIERNDHLTAEDRRWLVQMAGIAGIELRGLGLSIESLELPPSVDHVTIRLYLSPVDLANAEARLAAACECLAGHHDRSGRLTTHYELGRHYVEISYERSALTA